MQKAILHANARVYDDCRRMRGSFLYFVVNKENQEEEEEEAATAAAKARVGVRQPDLICCSEHAAILLVFPSNYAHIHSQFVYRNFIVETDSKYKPFTLTHSHIHTNSHTLHNVTDII